MPASTALAIFSVLRVQMKTLLALVSCNYKLLLNLGGETLLLLKSFQSGTISREHPRGRTAAGCGETRPKAASVSGALERWSLSTARTPI